MIISHRHRFVFIKTYKTASTSMEVMLAKHCGDDDLVTTIGPPVPGHVPRNYEGTRLRSHSSLLEARAVFGDRIDGYYTFCFERHPYEKTPLALLHAEEFARTAASRAARRRWAHGQRVLRTGEVFQ